MAQVSPTSKIYRRRQLQKQSAAAVSRAKRDAALSLPPGALRRFIANKAKRQETCAAMQHHRIVTPRGQPSFVASSNSRACHQRDCMPCEAKRANALARDTIELFDYVWEISPRARVLMLTLTSCSRPLDQAHAMLADHQKALKAFWKYERLLSATLGHFTNIEVTFPENNGRTTVHFHSHSLVVVERGALSDHRYIRQAEYVALWQRALKAAYKPVVDIRAIRSRDGLSTDPDSIRGAVREVCKYCLDTSTYLHHENGHVFARPEVALAFAVATHRRRLTSMDRIFLEAKKLRAKRRKAERQSHSGDNPDTDPEPSGCLQQKGKANAKTTERNHRLRRSGTAGCLSVDGSSQRPGQADPLGQGAAGAWRRHCDAGVDFNPVEHGRPQAHRGPDVRAALHGHAEQEEAGHRLHLALGPAAVSGARDRVTRRGAMAFRSSRHPPPTSPKGLPS